MYKAASKFPWNKESRLQKIFISIFMSFAPPLLEVQNGGWCSNSPDDSPQTGARLARTEQSDEALPGFTQILGLAGQGFALGEGMLFSSQYLSSKINQKTYLMMGFKRDPLKICSIPISLNWYTLSWCWAESSQAAMSLKPLRRFHCTCAKY